MEDNVEDLWILLDEGIPSRYPLAGCYLEISQKDDKRGLTKVLAKNRDLIRIYDQEILSPIFDSILLTPSINKEKLKGIEKFFRSSQFQCFKKRVDSKSELLFLFVEEKKRIHLYAKCQLADSPFLAERILPFLEFPSVIKTLIYQKLSTISRFRLLKANHQLRNIILTNGAFPKIVWSLRIDRGQEIRIQSTADSRPYEFQSEENFIDLCRAIQGVDSLTVADWDAQLLPLRELFPNLRHIKYFICPKESSFPNLANFFNESKADVFGETDLRFKREPGALEFEKNPFKDCCRIRVDGVIGILEFLRGIKVEVLEVSPRQKDQLEEMRFLIDHGIPSAHPCSYLQLYGSKMNTVNGGELIELCKEQKNIILSVDLSDKLLDSFKSFTEIFTGIDPRDLPIVFSFSKCFNPKICHYLLVAVNEYIYLLMQQSNE
ncbi:unnamed protein product, partial [Mesorhabditis belari]|uniref:F-box domain-containing protein n=1 Tax=Mesorhabditis belari TaxID=2138241 RepID=A0AAF3J3D8_9BILA